MHSRQQLKQFALVLHLFTTPYEWRIRLLTNSATTKSAASTSVIPAFGPSSNCRVKTFAETVPPLQLIPVCQHLVKASKVETCRVPLEIFEQSELRSVTAGASRSRWCSNSSIGCVGTSRSYKARNGLASVTGTGKIFGARLDSDMSGTRVGMN